MKNEETDISSLSGLLEEMLANEDQVNFTITAKAVRHNNDLVILNVLAGYTLHPNNEQRSWGRAWTTAGDGTTPVRVDRISIQIEVDGALSPSDEPASQDNADQISTLTRGVYTSTPQRVIAYASCKNPDIEAIDTSDD